MTGSIILKNELVAMSGHDTDVAHFNDIDRTYEDSRLLKFDSATSAPPLR